MKITVAVTLLAISCLADADGKEKTAPKTDKRDLLEGNYGDRTYARNVPRSVQGEDYSNNEDPATRPSQTYPPSSPRVAKISDVLSSEGPHYSAISEHLISPISPYQSRLPSQQLDPNQELSLTDSEYKLKPTKKQKKSKNPLQQTYPLHEPQNFQFETLNQFGNRQDLSQIRNLYLEPNTFDRGFLSHRVFPGQSLVRPVLPPTPHYYAQVYQQPQVYPAIAQNQRQYIQPIQYIQQHLVPSVATPQGQQLLPALGYNLDVQQAAPSVRYNQGTHQRIVAVPQAQNPIPVVPGVTYVQDTNQVIPGAAYLRGLQQLSPNIVYPQGPQQAGIQNAQDSHQAGSIYTLGPQQTAFNSAPSPHQGGLIYTQGPQQTGVPYTIPQQAGVPYAPRLQQAVLSYTQSPQLARLPYAHQYNQQVEANIRPNLIRIIPQQQPAPPQLLNLQPQQIQGAVSYASFSQSPPPYSERQHPQPQEQASSNQHTRDQGYLVHIRPDVPVTVQPLQPAPDNQHHSQQIPDSQPQSQQIPDSHSEPTLQASQEQAVVTIIPDKKESIDVQVSTQNIQTETNNIETTTQLAPQEIINSQSTHTPVVVTTEPNIVQSELQVLQEVSSQQTVEKGPTYLQQVQPQGYPQGLVIQQSGLVNRGVAPTASSVQFFGNYAESLFKDYH